VVYKPLDEHQLCVCLSQLLQEAKDRGRA
jgi:hypothetical protein